jgi:hypothetical protein
MVLISFPHPPTLARADVHFASIHNVERARGALISASLSLLHTSTRALETSAASSRDLPSKKFCVYQHKGLALAHTKDNCQPTQKEVKIAVAQAKTLAARCSRSQMTNKLLGLQIIVTACLIPVDE